MKRIRRTRMTYFLLIFLTGITMAGCSRPHFYIHPSPGLDIIKNIAIMPFDNFTRDEKAGEKVRTYFVVELLITGIFNVMDINEVDKILQREGLSYRESESTAPTRSTAPTSGVPETEEEKAASIPLSKKIGDVLNVEAILVGSVEAYSEERLADRTIPEVSISARLIDAETGIIIWASTHTRRGSAGMPIFGWGKVTSLSVLSQQVIHDMVNSLANPSGAGLRFPLSFTPPHRRFNSNFPY